jgi:hypothetical protein
MSSLVMALFIAFFVLAVIFFVFLEYRRYSSHQETQVHIRRAQQDASTTKKEMLGFTKYQEYLPAVTQAAIEQSKNLSVRVVREQMHVETSVPEAPASSPSPQGASQAAKPAPETSMVVKYSVEYVFGFELGPDNFQLQPGASGLEIRVNRPVLLSTPVVKPLSHGAPSKAKLTDDQIAVVKKLPVISKGDGARAALDEAVTALCEKKLVTYVRDSLVQQAGVKFIPYTYVNYL